MPTISAQISDIEDEALRKLAFEQKKTKSDILREAVERLLKKEGKL